MSGSSPRHGNRFSKSPPFLIPGLLVVIVILSFNYWRTSRLNKGLLESVAVADAKSQRLDHELKEANQLGKNTEETLKKDVERLKTRNGEMKELSESLEAEKAKVSQKLTDIDAELKRLTETHQQLMKSHEELNIEYEKKKGLEEEVKQQQSLITSLNTSVNSLSSEKTILLTYVSEELGRTGIEDLLKKSITLVDGVVVPPADQQPLCMKRAIEQFEANAAKNQKVIAENQRNAIIQSPNADMKDIPQKGVEGQENVDDNNGAVDNNDNAAENKPARGGESNAANVNADTNLVSNEDTPVVPDRDSQALKDQQQDPVKEKVDVEGAQQVNEGSDFNAANQVQKSSIASNSLKVAVTPKSKVDDDKVEEGNRRDNEKKENNETTPNQYESSAKPSEGPDGIVDRQPDDDEDNGHIENSQNGPMPVSKGATTPAAVKSTKPTTTEEN